MDNNETLEVKKAHCFVAVTVVFIVCLTLIEIVRSSLETYEAIQTTAMDNGLIESAVPGSKVILWVKPDAK